MRNTIRWVIPTLILALVSCSSGAQHLSRKARLGIAFNLANDSVARASGLASAQGVLINHVYANTTAATAGMQAGDILLSLNAQPVNNGRELGNAMSGLREGDAMAFEVMRSGQPRKLNAKAIGQPWETWENASAQYGEVPFRGGYLRTITARPNEGTNHPAILFVPGYNCFSMDNLPEGFVYQRIIQGYLDAGFVVHRIEKSGMGDNLNTPSCFETGFELEMDVFRAGMESMRELEGVDTENLFIFGHSLGGCIAPILAEEFQPKGVIVYGTVHTAWYEYLLRMLSVQNPLFGLDYAAHSHDMRHYHELLYRHYVQKESIETLATENPDFLRILQRDFQYQGGEQLFSRHTSFWQELNDKDLISAWKNTASYVLSMYGEADIEALDAWSHQEIVRIVNQYHPGRAEFRLLENTTHGMVSVKSREHAVEVARDFQYNSQHFNPKFLEITIAWMQDKVNREVGTP